MYNFFNLKKKENISFDEKFLIENLRKETFEVKDCFNKFSYQAIIFSAAILTFIFKEFSTQPYIALSAIPAIFLINIVIRIGIHKYSTANRNLGYELYLSRIENLKKNKKINNDDYLILKSQNWEEILRAWRIVQPIIFENIYLTEQNYSLEYKKIFSSKLVYKLLNHINMNPNLYRKNDFIKKNIEEYTNKTIPENYPWFDLRALTFDEEIEQSRYRGGSYLREMFIVLNTMQYVFLSIFVFFIINAIIYNIESKDKINYFIINTSPINHHIYVTNIIIYTLLLIFILFFVFVKHKVYKRRRWILENELLSIHSCSITWHAIVIAHLLALKNKNDYKHYTEELVIITKKMVKNKGDIFNIHEWIEKNHEKVFNQK